MDGQYTCVHLVHFTARRVCIARTMLSQDVRLSVRQSYGSVESKRLHISSKFFHHRVAPQYDAILYLK